MSEGSSYKRKLYKVWDSMKYRCYNPNCDAFENYGGRGIKICDEWRRNFHVFYEWAISNGYQEGLSIDRINNDGNYEPDNCRWATVKEQGNNRRTCVYVTINETTKTIQEWSDTTGIKVSTLFSRYYLNFSESEFLKPTKSKHPQKIQSGIKGITWDKNKEKWRLRVRKNGKMIHIGYYDTIEEANCKKKEIVF